MKSSGIFKARRSVTLVAIPLEDLEEDFLFRNMGILRHYNEVLKQDILARFSLRKWLSNEANYKTTLS